MDNPGSRPAKEIFGVELGEYDGPRFADKSFLAAMSARRIFQELEQLKKEPVPCCLASPAGDDITRWIIVITGPKDSVYADGTFFVEMEFPRMYPYSCPRVCFFFQKSVVSDEDLSPRCQHKR
ncbi:unnamed protein product [Gongylonema pulchrum]|uniref:UBIQUITIN_CONJUGAT_2 domain-containing protein n=1 Tax=Gongylonema pulchrum TaxID=637853 RepID=A0A183DUY7_9BILA|nr:unnamed protein product [Gongylonema pulchrum]